MPSRHLHLHPSIPPVLVDGLAAIRAELQVPDGFPSDVTAAAVQAAQHPRLPESDLTELAFETIDPEGSRDLDQAMLLERDGDGYRVRYAIADVGAFVTSGHPVDIAAHERGETRYAPDHRTPLHPPELSEGAASLLPGQVCPAFVWDLRLAADGSLTDRHVGRARVRSVAQHTYTDVDHALTAGTASPSLALLAEIGPLRLQQERDRGGVSLPLPEQQIDTSGRSWTLTFRSQLPVEEWNAQISLLTGIAAAQIMLEGKVGVLRTLPPAEQYSLDRLRHTARVLRIAWPHEQSYPDFVRSLDPTQPSHAAMLTACTRLFRGAGYRAFAGEAPTDAGHAAIAADYAHCTAPLRRLVDRYALEVCGALCAGVPVPSWVLDALSALPEEMAKADRAANAYERAIIDLVEAWLLHDRVGETFHGVIVEADEHKPSGVVVVSDWAVEAPVDGEHLPLGEEVDVVLALADPSQRKVRFRLPHA